MSPRGHSFLPSPNSTTNESVLVPEIKPMVPDLCIEQLWSETASSHRSVYDIHLCTAGYSGCHGFCSVSKVFVPGLLSPTFSLSNHVTHLGTPMESVSTPAKATGRHMRRIEEVPTEMGRSDKVPLVCFILPKDTAMKVLVKWYNIYNAPGGPSAQLEWNLFVTCFMTLMGYNTEWLG
ncbi:hypothetical protein J4Q44_G00360730 [Coregonus suidteri]|uniref:Uncharacterized protein n=1 Tax=Coregonus suidteri TaxID=861788 RepID=A0AAN8KJS5_9TELE